MTQENYTPRNLICHHIPEGGYCASKGGRVALEAVESSEKVFMQFVFVVEKSAVG